MHLHVLRTALRRSCLAARASRGSCADAAALGCARSGDGTGQRPTIWNTAIGATLLVGLTALVLYGLHDTINNHSFMDHFFS